MNSTTMAMGIVLGIILLRWVWPKVWTRRRLMHFWTLGQQALEQNDLDGAEAAFRRCVKLVPSFSGGRRILGRVLAQQEKLQEAELQLRFGADLEPRNAIGHLDLGFFLAVFDKGRDEEAVEVFSKALEFGPEFRGMLTEDPRLIRLRTNPRFRALLKSAP